VKVLWLDRREALATIYRRTDRRLRTIMEAGMQNGKPDGQLADDLRDADDAGLLGWYVFGTGHAEEPYASLIRQRPGLAAMLP
jgi:hypothetical protein